MSYEELSLMLLSVVVGVLVGVVLGAKYFGGGR